MTYFTPESFERLFDKFVDNVLGGNRLDNVLGGNRLDNLLGDKIKKYTKCADYFVPASRIIIELKTLNRDHADRGYIIQLAREAALRTGRPIDVVDQWLRGVAPLPKDIERVVNAKVNNSLKNSVRKANEQIKSARTLLKAKHDGILIVANLGEHLFGPVELLRILAVHALGRTALSIDAILLLTPGVAYATGNSEPQHYVQPVYAEGKTHLGDFVEPLVERWIEFEAAFFGLSPEIEKVFEFDERSKSARPVRRH